MAKIIAWYHAGKDDPIYSGSFTFTSNPKIQKYDDKNTSEQESNCLLYTSPSPRDRQKSRMPSSA